MRVLENEIADGSLGCGIAPTYSFVRDCTYLLNDGSLVKFGSGVMRLNQLSVKHRENV